VTLGEQSRQAGDLEGAEERFERALAADPRSHAAHLGLGRIALARGDLGEAERRFTAAARAEDEATRLDASLGLARVARRQGRGGEARERLEGILAVDPLRAEAHAALAALTGPAPRGPADLAESLRRTRAHPYDLVAALAASRALAAAGRHAEATRRLESVLWLADLDPAAAREVWALLRQLEPSWREWRLVPVHSWADESIRTAPAWRFRLRIVWLRATRALGALLRVRFVPAGFQGFESRATSSSLDAIHDAFTAQVRRVPPEGIVAALTAERPAPAQRSARLGKAEFLGRRLVVRLDEPAASNRVLLHELLHLYGAVHVARDVKSLMNPSGGTETLDPLNAAIVGEIGVRGFRGDLERDVLDVIDLDATTAAYEEALRANLVMRNAGLTEAAGMANRSPVVARQKARRATELDPHLGDVARFVAMLYLRRDAPASAAFLFEKAARLYGPDTARGRRSAREAERIWETILPPPR
jgi:Tfp pilus assembly protein PilF